MTTVYLAAEGQPATHVLIVGVGSYTYAHGGVTPVANPRGLGQLTSPPVSAKAMIDWFLAPLLDPAAVGFRNPGTPLASVEALIAAPLPVEVQSPSGPVALDGATLDEVRAAFERWRARVVAQPGSTGIFYFCGHGVTAGPQYLLCQDMLRNEGVPWEKAFNVDGTLLTLSKEAPDCHIHFWIDACREVVAEILLSDGRPFPLRSTPANSETVERSHSLLQATGDSKLAFSKEGKTSRFTTALLTSLSGYAGSSKYGSPWRVDAAELASAVKALLGSENKTAERKQSSSFSDSGEGVAIVELLGPPKVKVSLDLAPDEMRPHAEIYLESCNGAADKAVHPCVDGAYVIEVSKGIYNLGAQSTSGTFTAAELANEFVDPPLYDHVFEVAP